MREKSFLHNLITAFGAQAISLLSSVVVSFFIPKVLGVSNFAIWQLFLFYCTYAGIFHFGLSDGNYLRLGGKEYKKLDYSSIKTQLTLMTGVHLCVGVGVVLIAVFFWNLDIEDKLIVCATVTYIVLYNIHGYIGFVHQAVNQTAVYSFSIFVEKLFFLLTVIAVLLFRVDNALPLILLFTVSKMLACVYIARRSKEILRADVRIDRNTIQEVKSNIRVGLSLMISNFASMLILGIGKQFVEWQWGLEVFGKFSFSITLSNFFLQFISQVSMVLFPLLRRYGDESLHVFYRNARESTSILFPLVFVLYIPLKAFLSWWLPDYADSLILMGYLLPLCTYDGKMSLVYATHLKVLNKERVLLLINIVTLLFSATISVLSVYVIKNVLAVAVGMVFCVAFRCIISDVILGKYMHCHSTRLLLYENLLVVVYFLIISKFNDLISFALILLLTIMYMFINRQYIAGWVKKLMIGKTTEVQSEKGNKRDS